eukprot:719067-Pelagomonas_calceolata.AAC.4
MRSPFPLCLSLATWLSSSHDSSSPDHDFLAFACEAGGEELGEVLLDEPKHEHVTQRGHGDDEDDGEGDESEQVPGGAFEGRHLSWFQRPA